ncbi:MAG: hypothetical protein J1F01_07865 [Oscillospiraceae bacterium]|nr:hypothetical protein [Oscillospiraceae bacterium]
MKESNSERHTIPLLSCLAVISALSGAVGSFVTYMQSQNITMSVIIFGMAAIICLTCYLIIRNINKKEIAIAETNSKKEIAIEKEKTKREIAKTQAETECAIAVTKATTEKEIAITESINAKDMNIVHTLAEVSENETNKRYGVTSTSRDYIDREEPPTHVKQSETFLDEAFERSISKEDRDQSEYQNISEKKKSKYGDSSRMPDKKDSYIMRIK